MKQKLTFLLVLFWLLLLNLSWAECPEDPIDLGFCDTLHVVPWSATDTCIIYQYPDHTDTICINNPGENFPCFFYVNLLVTHDSNSLWWHNDYPNPGDSTLVQDSIFASVVPLGWTRTNPTAYCSLSTYWNENTVDPEEEGYPRRIWRNFPPLGSDSLNRMGKLKWEIMIVDMSSDSIWWQVPDDGVLVPPHVFMALIAGAFNKKWYEGNRILLATLTFRIEDTMHVCIDSTFWPPNSRLRFVRYDASPYFPRDNMPLSMWVGPPPLVVTSPNDGENWCGGKTQEITWNSEGFSGPFVKIDYSTNAGTNWLPIVDSTQNDGTYAWTIPGTLSNSCLVKVSDPQDGDPYDESDNFFTIFRAGDTDADGRVYIVDVVYLINYIFINGPAPIPLKAGDVNLDGMIDITDVVYLINYLFLNGPAPLC
jgi:hypothetical protein